MIIKKQAQIDIYVDTEELAKLICGEWSDSQGRLLLEISKIAGEHKWQAQNQVYEIGRNVFESMTEEERQKVYEFIRLLKDFVVDFNGRTVNVE